MRTAPILSPIKSPFPTPPGPVVSLLEGFENVVGNVPTGMLVWTFNPGPGIVTFTSSNLHVTQGAHSGLLTDDTGGSSIVSSGNNLSAYKTILMDVYVAAMDSGDQFKLLIEDGIDFTHKALTTVNGTGAFALSVDISGWAGRANCAIHLSTNGLATAPQWFADNLRGST